MTDVIDLGPAARRLADVVTSIRDDQLTVPTPCTHYSVGDLLDHVNGLSLAFTWAATKTFPEQVGDAAPSGDASRLDHDWRSRIPAQLDALADAWRDAEAWTGMTKAGGVDLPGQIGGLVALDEIVVHGWDLARATGQVYDVDEAAISHAVTFAEMFTDEDRGDAFGPPVPTGPDATPLARLMALTGRDPAWTG